jgi:hypothetical protein
LKTQSFGRSEPIYSALVGRGRGRSRGRGHSPAVVVDNPLAFADRFEKRFVLAVVAALLDYRRSRENGEPQDNLEIFPSAGFENLKISSVANKPGDFWPDQSGRYWWRLTLEDGSINEDFSWTVDEKSSSGFIVYGQNDVKMKGFSWEEDDRGMSHHVEYTECGSILEWMKRKDQSYSARIESAQPRYISVPQGRTCRYDSNMILPNAPIAGLYSDDFSICCAVILYKKDDITGQVKISYTHVDQLVKFEQIAEELAWMGGDAQMLLYYKRAALKGDILEEVLESFVPDAFKQKQWGDGEDNFGLAITLDGTPKYFSRNNLPKLITHPQEWSISASYQINLAMLLIDGIIDNGSHFNLDSDDILESQRLLFDGYSWKEPLLHDKSLMPNGQIFYDHVLAQLPQVESFSGKIVSPIINRYFESRLRSDILMSLTKSFLILAAKNNYQLLFNNDLEYLLKAAETARLSEVILYFLKEIIANTKEDFTLLSSFILRIDNILERYRNEEIKSELLGLYKLYLRFQQKDSQTDIKTMMRDEHSIADDMQRITLLSSPSSSSSSTTTPQVEFQAVHEEYNPGANSQRQKSPASIAPNYATFSCSDSTVPEEEVRSLDRESLSAEKEEESVSPRFG